LSPERITGRDKQGALLLSLAEDRARTRAGKTMWINGCYSATEHGSTLLRRFIPRRKFPFPKSLYAVEDALRFYVGHKTDALIVDFFAGSGTTAHAVARLNHQDGGKRQSISITNNEVSEEEATSLREKGLRPGDPAWEALGIFQWITRPRLTAALTGKTHDGKPIVGNYRFIDEFPMAQGFAENFEFLELEYLDGNAVSRGKAFASIAPLLWMKAGAQGTMIAKETRPYAIPKDARYGVLFDVNHWQRFVESVRVRDDLKSLFIVTDSLAQYQQVAAELPTNIDVSMLYEDYLRNFEINVGGAL
jgi:adenine-specific DNA-methyltransferase